jgi:hypothetical protein
MYFLPRTIILLYQTKRYQSLQHVWSKSPIIYCIFSPFYWRKTETYINIYFQQYILKSNLFVVVVAVVVVAVVVVSVPPHFEIRRMLIRRKPSLGGRVMSQLQIPVIRNSRFEA